MSVLVALLRGVNVGGHGRLAMAELRTVVADAGFADVRTYVQSGNVVLRAPDGAEPAEVAATLRDAIAAGTETSPDVLVRTRDELAAVVEAQPFADRGAEPTALHVVFTDADAGAGLAGVDLAAYAPEEAAAVGRELFLHLPGGIGRSRLAADLSRRRGPAGTARNWRTVTRLLAMADEASAREAAAG